MKLYLNRKEDPHVKASLKDVRDRAQESSVLYNILRDVIKRIELCEKLQDNHRKAGASK